MAGFKTFDEVKKELSKADLLYMLAVVRTAQNYLNTAASQIRISSDPRIVRAEHELLKLEKYIKAVMPD